MKKQYIYLLFFGLLLYNSSFAQNNNEKHPILTDRFIINAGLFTPLKTIKIGANGKTPNKEINFDEAFKLNRRETTIFGNFVWRYAKKWNFGVEYFAVKSGHTIELEKDIDWEDITFKAGFNVKGGFGLKMYRIYFGRTIFSGINHEFGGGLGVHAMNINTFIQGEAFAGDLEVGFEKKSVSAVAPFPNIGLWYYYTPNIKWALTARIDWFTFNIGDFTGSLWNVAPGVKYQILKNLGVGFNYRYFKTSLKINKPNWDGNLNVIFQGPLFTLSTNF